MDLSIDSADKTNRIIFSINSDYFNSLCDVIGGSYAKQLIGGQNVTIEIQKLKELINLIENKINVNLTNPIDNPVEQVHIKFKSNFFDIDKRSIEGRKLRFLIKFHERIISHIDADKPFEITVLT